MLCEKCHENPAEISVKTQVNGFTRTHHLCSSCAKKEGLFLSPFDNFNMGSMENLLGQNVFALPFDMAQITQEQIARQNLKKYSCPECGQSFQDFQQNGLFGCPHCYIKFRPVIEALLDEIHGGHQHVLASKGLTLAASSSNMTKTSRPEMQEVKKEKDIFVKDKTTTDQVDDNELLGKLKKLLNEAIAAEHYEQAAIIRDQIKAAKEKSGDTEKDKGGAE